MQGLSPFSLLRGVDEAREVLILSFVANLEFFERFVLAETRGLQAASTIVADANMVTADPALVRGAGVRYSVVRASCPGGTAFHPKLMVVVGSDSATVAVGSGNLTLAGWHGSEELWTVLRATPERGPSGIADVARFLRLLTDGRVTLSAEGERAIGAVVELLDLMDASEPGSRIVSSLERPIVKALPTGGVDEMIAYAPFFDVGLQAITAAYDRLQPKQLTVFVQRDTSVDGPKLERWVGERGGELAWCSDERYRHGKLIEWARDGQRTALTGSPNISAPALLNTIGNGSTANCELAVVTEVSETLSPERVPPPTDGAAALVFGDSPDDSRGTAIVLLGAVLVEGETVELELLDAPESSAQVQVYDEEKDWVSIPGLTVEAGAQQSRVPALMGLAAGRSVRLLTATGASNAVAISDPVRARRRPIRREGPEIGGPADVVAGGEFAKLYAIAEQLRPHLLQLRVPRERAPKAAEPPSHEDAAASRVSGAPTLEDYLEACSRVVDEEHIRWALALPVLPGLTSAAGSGSWTAELDDETGDAAADAGEGQTEEVGGVADALAQASEKSRADLRRFCNRAFEQAESWPYVMRAYVSRLALHGAAEGLWDERDARDRVLAAVVGLLGADGEELTAEERAGGAVYVAVALGMLFSALGRRSVIDEATLRARAAAEKGGAMLSNLDVAQVEGVVAELGSTVRGDEILEAIELVREPPSPVEEAIAILEESYEIQARPRRGGGLVIEGALPAAPELRLLRAIALLDDLHLAVAEGEMKDGRQAGCVRYGRELLIFRRTAAGLTANLFELGEGRARARLAGWQIGTPPLDNLPRPKQSCFGGAEPPLRMRELLGMAGFDTDSSAPHGT